MIVHGPAEHRGRQARQRLKDLIPTIVQSADPSRDRRQSHRAGDDWRNAEDATAKCYGGDIKKA